MAEAICVRELSKTFGKSNQALKNVSVDIEQGEMVALIGASGSGKSTLLRHIAGLVESDNDRNTSVTIFGEPIQANGSISPHARAIRSTVGVVFQQFNLVGRLKVLTNVLMGHLGTMPRWKGTLGLFSNAEREDAMRALERVGISAKALQRGSTLSGGQQQRAAIARTLVQGARLLIADEPIASLDPASARKVMEILKELNREDRITVMVSLHQVEYALKYCPRTVALRDGEIVYDGPSDALTPQFLNELYGAESESLFVPQIGETAAQPSRKPETRPVADDARDRRPQPVFA